MWSCKFAECRPSHVANGMRTTCALDSANETERRTTEHQHGGGCDVAGHKHVPCDEQPRQVSQERTANEVREEHEEVRRELGPQLLFRWQATTEVETLTEQPTGHWAARAQEERVGRLLTQNLADAVTVTRQALGSNWEWETHCKLWATTQILLRTPLSSGDNETNPCKGKINAVREVADRCKYSEGGDSETLARQPQLEKVKRQLVMEDVRNQMETQTEEAAKLKKAQAAVRNTGPGRNRSC